MVADVISETPDTATLVLFTGNDRLDYKPGHFLTVDPHQFESLERFTAFLEDLKGKKEPPRAYSMSSAPHEKQLAFTIKEERYASGATKYPPLLSPLLVRRTARGARLVITGFTGPYTLPDDVESRTDHIVHVCAGSGIVPNFSIIKHALLHHPRLRHTLVYSNRTWADTIFGRDLNALEAKHPEQLRVVHTLTRQEPAPGSRARCARAASPRRSCASWSATRPPAASTCAAPRCPRGTRRRRRRKGSSPRRASWRARWPRWRRSASRRPT